LKQLAEKTTLQEEEKSNRRYKLIKEIKDPHDENPKIAQI